MREKLKNIDNDFEVTEKDFDPDFDTYDDNPFTDEEEELSNELFNLVFELIEDEYLINEEFISTKALNQHFIDHCISTYKNRKSRVDKVYYDFLDVNKYRLYEEEVSKKLNNPTFSITTLNDTNGVLKAFNKLFEGNKTVKFEISCGFFNNVGKVMVGINSFSSDKTKNYSGGNTVDILILSRRGKTISMYPIDSHYLETKFNNIVQKHSTFLGKFTFNVD